ncbi:MAG: hypothetical protein AAGI23_15000 [Bacteroidota bacterium]
MRKSELLQKVIFQIGFGGLLLVIWYMLERPKHIIESGRIIGEPSTELYIYVMSWVTLAGALGLLVVGFVGLVSLLIKK